jgi:hypothetical protein
MKYLHCVVLDKAEDEPFATVLKGFGLEDSNPTINNP